MLLNLNCITLAKFLMISVKLSNHYTIAVNNLTYNLDAVYGQTKDESTQTELGRHLKRLKKQEALICPPPNSLIGGFFGMLLGGGEADFESTSDVLVADLGGFDLALGAYKGYLVEASEFKKNGAAFMHKTAEVLCVHSDLDVVARGATNECRIKLFSRTKGFTDVLFKKFWNFGGILRSLGFRL